MRKLSMVSVLAISLATVAMSGAAQATVIYGNSASFGNNPIHLIDSTTGMETARYTGQPSGNGRGVVVVGNSLYYTVVGDPNIYILDVTTGTPTGSILTQNQSMSTIAWDGSHFWTADYSGTNQAFRIDPATGMNVATITLANAQSNMDGLEWFNGMLIGNRCDACGTYDIYDLSGNVLDDAFIVAPGSATGIAFDGTNFLVSNIFDSSIGVYDGTSGLLLNTINLSSQFGSFLIEDLSVDYAQRPDTGGVPEPSTWAMMLLGFGAVGFGLRRRKEVAATKLRTA